MRKNDFFRLDAFYFCMYKKQNIFNFQILLFFFLLIAVFVDSQRRKRFINSDKIQFIIRFYTTPHPTPGETFGNVGPIRWLNFLEQKLQLPIQANPLLNGL